MADTLESSAIKLQTLLQMQRNGHEVKLVWPSPRQASLTEAALKVWIATHGTAVVTIDGLRYFVRLQTVP